MRTALKIGFCGVLLGGMIAALWYRHRANDRLATEIESLRRQNSDFTVLQADNRRLIADAPDRAEAARKKREELARLQAQIMTGKKHVEAAKRGRAQTEVLSQSNENQVSPPVLGPGMMLGSAMQNVGRASPGLAMQTGLWAQRHGDAQTMAAGLAFEPEARVKLDALFAELSAADQAQFGSPERLVAALATEANSPSHRGGGPEIPIQIVEKMQDPATAEVLLRLQLPNGQVKDGKLLQLRHHADGWKIVLPVAEVEWLEAMWKALPPSQRLRLGGK